MRVLILRPEPKASVTADRLKSDGITAVVAPMLTIHLNEDVATAAIEAAGGRPTAVLLTSANAVAALRRDPRMTDLLDVPVIAVGPATASAARTAGFIVVIEADGDGAAVAALAADRFDRRDRLVHVAGRDRAGDLDGDLAGAGLSVAVVEAYRAEMTGDLAPDLVREVLSGGFHAVVVGSGRTAEAFRRCLLEATPVLPLRGGIPGALVAISEAAAAPLAGVFERVLVAARPNGEGLAESVVALKAALENNEQGVSPDP